MRHKERLKNGLRVPAFFLLLFVLAIPVRAADDGGLAGLRESSKAFAAVARKVSPSVVFIQVESIQKNVPATPFPSPFEDDFFRRFFGEPFPGFPQPRPPQGERRALGQGSGFAFMSDKGLLSDTTYILTNNHVVSGADKISVTAQDGREFEAEVTGADPKSDLAVIEIKGNLPPLKMSDSAQLEVGEWVVAIGNPFGLSHSLTVGVVSAKGRRGLGINDYEDFIQTDAAINPGNSGGPLVNLDGEVVGINTAIFSRSGGYMGVGFAIPANLAQNIAQQLIDRGEVTRGFLGIVIQDLTPDLAESFDLGKAQGILVSQVSEGSPAAKAGLKTGDLIVEYQGKPVSEIGDFRNRVALTPPGARARLTLLREGRRIPVEVIIGDQGDAPLMAQAETSQAQELGLAVQTLSPELAEQFDAPPGRGVVVTEVRPGSVAALAGIRRGTVILQVDRKAVNSAAAFQQALKNAEGKNQVLLLISEQGRSRFVALRWG